MSASAVRPIHIEYPTVKVSPTGGVLWPTPDSRISSPWPGDHGLRGRKRMPFGREWLHAGPGGGDAA